MIKHVVLFRIKAVPAQLDSYKAKLKADLDRLSGLIGQIRRMETGVSREWGQRHSDVALVSEFDSWADLEAYAKHPEHLRLIEQWQASWAEVRVVDFEV